MAGVTTKAVCLMGGVIGSREGTVVEARHRRPAGQEHSVLLAHRALHTVVRGNLLEDKRGDLLNLFKR